MTWLLRTLDRLAGAAVAAMSGMVLSQAPGFSAHYLHRLGLQAAEARAALTEAVASAGGSLPGPLAEALALRVMELEHLHQTLTRHGPWGGPLVLVGHMDGDLFLETLEHFVPTLPFSAVELSYWLAGVALGLLAYDVLKLPLGLLGHRSRRRRLFETRSGL